MRWSIRWKLILAIGIPLMVVYGVMLALVADQVRGRARQQLEIEVAELASLHAARLDGRLQAVAQVAESAAAALSALPELSEEEVRSVVAAQIATDPMASGSRVELDGGRVRRDLSFHLTNARGVPVFTDAPARQWLEAMRGGEAPVWTEPYPRDGDTGPLVCSHGAPVVHGGVTTGVVTVDLELDRLPEQIGSIVHGGPGFTILNANGTLLKTPDPRLFEAGGSLAELAMKMGRPEFEDFARQMTSGETGVIRADGLFVPDRTWFYYAPIPSAGLYFVAAVPESIILEFSQTQLRLGLIFLLAGLLVILVLLWFMASRITQPIGRLAFAVGDLASGNLDAQVMGVHTRDEVGQLANAFNRMVGELKTNIELLQGETAAREAVESELRVAREIQTALLPSDFPRRDEFELHAVNHSAKHVAGDFFDFFYLGDNTLVFLIADVSGKGVPAALFMTVAKTILRHAMRNCSSISDALKQANGILEENNPGSMYVTLFVGWFDIRNGNLHYANAAHPSPYRVEPSGHISELGETTGPILGLLPFAEFEERSDRLHPGDRLVLFTDGVPEAADRHGEFYGDERLKELLSSYTQASATDLCRSIATQADAFQQGRLNDDVTVMVLKRGQV